MAHSSKRILVVEDDLDIRGILTELLEDSGYNVTGAANGADALEKLKIDTDFNLILLDLMMPIMNGLEFRSHQKNDSRISEIPVVVMSADGQANEKTRCAEVNGYLKKPLDLNDFLATVAREIKGES